MNIEYITQKLDQYDALLMQGDGKAAFNLKLGIERTVVPDERMLANEIKRLTKQLADCRNFACQLCGKYKTAHLGSCRGCRWNGEEGK